MKNISFGGLLARIVTVLVFVAVAFSLCVPLLVSATADAEEWSADFSLQGSPHTATLSPSSLLEIIIGKPLSEEERKYVDEKSNTQLSYDTGITTDTMHVFLPEDSEGLAVYADSYSYTAQNGVVVTWIPTLAALDGHSAAFTRTEGEKYGYIATIEDVKVASEAQSPAVSVTYSSTFKIPRSVANALLNLAYKDAVAARGHVELENERYEDALEEHRRQTALYAQYLIDLADYESKLAVYEQYLSDYAEYEAACLAREEYEAALLEYEKQKLLYAEYLTSSAEYEKKLAEYLVYKDELAIYNEKNAKYEAYESLVARYRSHLAIIDAVKVPMTDERTLYDAIMGTTVTQVLSKKKEIVAAGAPEALVEIAGDATEKLRTLFDAYFSLETEEEKYVYYSSYYSDFKSAFYDLLRALDYFYTMDNNTGLVRTELVKEGKCKKYVILLAQLYLITSSLSDEKIYTYPNEAGVTVEFTDTYKWSYSETMSEELTGRVKVVTPVSMLENVVYLTDTDSAMPFDAQFPTPVEKPEIPTEVEKPEAPAPVAVPHEPEFVEEAGDEPEEKYAPTPVEEVRPPIEEPTPYTPTDEEAWLSALLADGTLTEREELSEDFSLEREVAVNKKVYSGDETAVYFYPSRDSHEPIYTAFVDSGSAATFRGTLPTKASDERYHYTFSHWVDSESKPVDLSSVTGAHLYLYPEYTSTDVIYTVSWDVDGTVYETKHKYGDTPVLDRTPEKAKDGKNVYSFASWQPAVLPVSSDAVYTAVFDSTAYYTLTWIADGKTVASTECLETEAPTPPRVPEKANDSLYKYSFSEWDKPLMPPTSDMTYTAVFEREYILPCGSGGAKITVGDGVLTLDAAECGADALDFAPASELMRDRSLTVILPSGAVTLSRAVVSLLLEDGVSSVCVSSFAEDAEGRDYAVRFYLKDGTEQGPYTYDAAFAFDLEYDYSMRLYTFGESGERVFVPSFSVSDGTLRARKLSSGALYSFAKLYTVSVLPSEMMEISASHVYARAGERVEISCIIPEGVSINRLCYVYFDGVADREVAIGSDSFLMPAGAVSIWGRAARMTFTVRFVNYDGKVIERVCEWGHDWTDEKNAAKKPPTYKRNPDAEYSYSFVGWDKELVTVFEDATYTAVYEKTPLPQKNEENKASFFTLYLIAVYRNRGIVLVSLAVSLASVIGFVLYKKYRKKHPIS